MASASPRAPARVPPHDIDAEGSVLSALMRNDPTALDEVLALLRVEDFYEPRCADVFAAIREVHEKGKPIDVVTVASRLKANHAFERVGGFDALERLARREISVEHVGHHAGIVRDKAKQRRAIELMRRAVDEGHADVGSVDGWLDGVAEQLNLLSADAAESGATPTWHDGLVRVFERLTHPEARDPGVTTGLPDLDSLLEPLLPGQLIVVGAHGGIGKSALATQIAAHVSRLPLLLAAPEGGQVEVPQAVLIFSAEMKLEEIAQRALFGEARVNSRKINRPGALTTDDLGELEKAARRLRTRNVFTDDRAGITVLQIRSRARRVRAEAERAGCKLRLIIVDYLQLIDGAGGGRAHERREREVANVSIALKRLAGELSVPVIVLAQLNEDARRDRRPPRKEDLRESKQIGLDADKVILIHNPNAAARTMTRWSGQREIVDRAPELCDLLVDKNRGGDQSRVAVRYYPSFTIFAPATPEDLEALRKQDEDAEHADASHLRRKRASRGRWTRQAAAHAATDHVEQGEDG